MSGHLWSFGLGVIVGVLLTIGLIDLVLRKSGPGPQG